MVIVLTTPIVRKTSFIPGFFPESSIMNPFEAGLLARSTDNAFPPEGSGILLPAGKRAYSYGNSPGFAPVFPFNRPC